MTISSMRVAAVAAAFICLSPPGAAQSTYSTESLADPERPPALTFPREIDAEGGTIIMHVPQVDTWKDFESVTGRFAVEVTPNGEAEAVIGTAEFVADTDANLEERVVAIDNTQIIVTSFPVANENRRAQLDRLVRSVAQQRTQYVPLDVMLSYIAEDATLPEEEGLSFDPPPIFYSSTPAILVMTDGEPVLAPIADSRLKYAVNTNWDLFQYKDRDWYLRFDRRWLKSRDLSGGWKFDNSLPGDFRELPDDGNWVEVKAAVPPAKGDKQTPVVFYSDKPAELIVTNGPPSLSTISSGGLEYVHDTESDLFRYDNRFYYLVSGRWFSAPALKGPWQHVAKLPAEFANIPANGPKGHVLAAVAGTEEARLAILEASIPRKATVSRDAGENILVFYQGDPKFGPIAETGVQRAINSSNDVLLYEGVYYLCENAVWYRSDSAEGPWAVADMIPAAIYDIPPSSAAYHVTHVHVYDSDSDSVSTGYTSGYFGIHVGFGIAMYGSGWYYPPYWGRYYYPRPPTWGLHVGYNPWTGWNFGVSWSNGFFSMGASWGGGYGYYRPGRCCGGWYGGGYRRPPIVINNSGNINIGNTINVGNRNHIGRQVNNNIRLNKANFSNRNIYQRPENRSRVADRSLAQSNLKQARSAKGRANNVFAGSNGEVARKVGDQWQTRDKGKWQANPELNRKVSPQTREQVQQHAGQMTPEERRQAQARAEQAKLRAQQATPQQRQQAQQQVQQRAQQASPQQREAAARAAQQRQQYQQRQAQPANRRQEYNRAYSARQAGASRERSLQQGRGGGGNFNRGGGNFNR